MRTASHPVTTALVLAAVLVLHVVALAWWARTWLDRAAAWTAACDAESAAEQLVDAELPDVAAETPDDDVAAYGDVPEVPFTWAPWWEQAA